MARISMTIRIAKAGGKTVSVSSGAINAEAAGHTQPHRQPVQSAGGSVATGHVHRNQLAASG